MSGKRWGEKIGRFKTWTQGKGEKKEGICLSFFSISLFPSEEEKREENIKYMERRGERNR